MDNIVTVSYRNDQKKIYFDPVFFLTFYLKNQVERPATGINVRTRKVSLNAGRRNRSKTFSEVSKVIKKKKNQNEYPCSDICKILTMSAKVLVFVVLS